MSVCVIGCIFGKKFSSVYPSVKNHDAYLFTNNPELRETIEKAGWKYIFIDFMLTDDDAISSFQSKYIKFLQFLKDESFKYFKKYDMIVYTDHKLELIDKHVENVLNKMEDKSILVMKHFQNRKNIWIEVGEAMFQERYQWYMTQTIDYIKEKIVEGYTENCVIVLTGLIVYSHLKNETIEFTDKIYKDLLKIGTSQCQIVWSLIGQKYENIIKTIEWGELAIKPEEPKEKERELLSETDNVIEFLKESVTYLKHEFRNKTAHRDLLIKSVTHLKEEIKNETEYVEQLIEKKNLLEGELKKETDHVEQLIISERRLNAEINNILNSKSWKIATKLFAVKQTLFQSYHK